MIRKIMFYDNEAYCINFFPHCSHQIPNRKQLPYGGRGWGVRGGVGSEFTLNNPSCREGKGD